jgi:hypothetical protein
MASRAVRRNRFDALHSLLHRLQHDAGAAFHRFLARHNLEWLVLVLAVTVFPAVIYL